MVLSWKRYRSELTKNIIVCYLQLHTLVYNTGVENNVPVRTLILRRVSPSITSLVPFG